MRTVILVDDEPRALEGLTLMIDWAAAGFAVAGCYGGGEAALAAIDALAPDLVVTDLYMPGMDGVALMQAARAAGYGGQFVIASGYQDFEMAQQALRYGAVGYLLKPIDPDEALQTLAAVQGSLARQELQDEDWRLEALRQAQLQALLTRADAPHDLLEAGALWTLAATGPAGEPEAAQAMLTAAGVRGYPLILHGTQYVAYTGALDAPLGEDVLTGEAGPPASLCGQAQAIVDQLAAREVQACALLEEMARQVGLLEEEAWTQGIDTLARLSRIHPPSLRRGLLSAWWDACYEHLTRTPQDAQTYLAQLGARQALMDAPFVPAMARIGQVTTALLRQRDTSITELMLRYIQAHYSRGISLATMAQELGHSSAYLGRVFRREMGMSYRQYLNGYRLARAAERITAERTPIYRIAEDVGYTKYAYFLEKFKAAYGMMPDAYRRKKV